MTSLRKGLIPKLTIIKKALIFICVILCCHSDLGKVTQHRQNMN
jgi:hypothetical protein